MGQDKTSGLDWRQKADAYNARETAQQEAREGAERRRQEEWKREAERRERERQRLANVPHKLFGGLYACYLCGHTSREKRREVNTRVLGGGEGDVGYEHDVKIFNEPGDLIKCRKCGKWVCDSDYHGMLDYEDRPSENCSRGGFCRECARKL